MYIRPLSDFGLHTSVSTEDGPPAIGVYMETEDKQEPYFNMGSLTARAEGCKEGSRHEPWYRKSRIVEGVSEGDNKRLFIIQANNTEMELEVSSPPSGVS